MSREAPPSLAEFVGELARLLARELAQQRAATDSGEQNTAPPSPWLSAESAARYLDWPVGRLYKLTARNEIPHYKQEGRLLFRRDELDRWLQHFAQTPSGTG